jgi:hypothetical protein
MTEEEIKALRKEVKKHKRVAGEWAAKLHDLVEERLPAAYGEIPELAQATYEACQEWEKAKKALNAAEG